MIYYILNGKEIEEVDVYTWIDYFQKANKVIRKTNVGSFIISTAFLGIDHNFFGSRDPLLFETAIMDKNGYIRIFRRCSTYEEAEKSHQIAIDVIDTKINKFRTLGVPI